MPKKGEKYVKMLSLVAVAAAAMMAFAGVSSARAAVLCKAKVVTSGSCATGWALGANEIHAVSEAEPTLTSSLVTLICTSSTISFTPTGEGSGTTTVSGPVTVLTFTNCNCNVVVALRGTLEIHSKNDTTGNGTLTSNGATVEITCATIFGNIKCNYVTSNKDLGTLTGSTTTGATATMDITTKVELEKLGSSELCDAEAILHANYSLTTPDTGDVATATTTA